MLRRLDEAALDLLLGRAEAERTLPLTPDARHVLRAMADGDGRYLLNMAEQLQALPPGTAPLDPAALSELLAKRAALYDKDREEHYNLISALHKSLRGSDPDAALYWFARMLTGGEDPRYIARRLVRFASEDVGMADPQALVQATLAWDTYERLGSPEGELAIAQAVVYLGTAPKSNAVYAGFKAAMRLAKETGSLAPPAHILNAPTRLMKELGYGAGYAYDHDAEEAFSGQDYFPDGVERVALYRPVDRGFERELGRRMAHWGELRAGRQGGGAGARGGPSPRSPPSRGGGEGLSVSVQTVTEDEADLRLDRFLRRRFPALTQGVLQKLCRTGQIRVDGHRVEASARLVPGQAVRVPPMPAAPEKRAPTVTPADVKEMERMVLHRDDQVIVLNKPSGLATQGGPGITRHLDGMLDALREDGEHRPRLVHRLDRDTSGVIVLARSPGVAAKLAAAFRTRDVSKTYWAVVVGHPNPEEGQIDQPLKRVASAFGERTEVTDRKDKEGQRAYTNYRMLDAAGRKLAWLELQPLTGRNPPVAGALRQPRHTDRGGREICRTAGQRVRRQLRGGAGGPAAPARALAAVAAPGGGHAGGGSRPAPALARDVPDAGLPRTACPGGDVDGPAP